MLASKQISRRLRRIRIPYSCAHSKGTLHRPWGYRRPPKGEPALRDPETVRNSRTPCNTPHFCRLACLGAGLYFAL